MKSFAPGLLFVCLLSGLPAWGGWLENQVRGSSTLARLSTASLAVERCLDLLRPRGIHRNEDTRKGCASLLRGFSKALDMESISRPRATPLAVVFRSDLLRVIEDPRLDFLIQSWKQDLDSVLFYPVRVSLFDRIQQVTKDRFEALIWAAALFQDVTPLRAHLIWLEQQPISTEALQRLSKFHEILEEQWRLSQIKRDLPGQLFLFPSDVEASLGSSLSGKVYHFYVPAVLAMKLDQLGFAREVSIFTAYHFNFAYEAVSEGAGPELLWKDPAKLVKAESARDTYLGLRGALWASNPAPGIAPDASFVLALQESIPKAHHSFLAHLATWFRESGW